MGKPAAQGSIPNLTIVFLAALTASALLWLEGDSPVGALAILAVVFTPILVYFLTASSQAAVGVMIAAAAASHYIVPISGLNVAPEHLAVAVLCVILPVWLKRDSQRPIWNLVDGLLVAYILMNLVSSVFMSVAPGQNLRWAVQQALVILPYFLLRFFLTDRRRFEKAFQIFVVIGTMQAAYAIVCFFSNILFGTDFGMALDQYGQIPGTYGMQREANILGAYSCGCFVALLVMYFKSPRVRLLVGVAITWAAVMISLSRGAIGAAGIVCLVAAFYGIKKKLLSGRLLIRVVVTVVLTTFLLAPALAPSYIERAKESAVSDPMEDTNVKLRLFQSAIAMEDIIQHPVLGNGTASFQLSFSYEDLGYGDVDQGAWISNVEMRVLHDTGIIGFAAFVLFLGYLLVRSWKVARRESSTEMLALFVSALVYVITFQATEATMLSFGWIHLGLMGSGLAAYTARPRPSLVTEANFR
jgi:O-antigen ligase